MHRYTILVFNQPTQVISAHSCNEYCDDYRNCYVNWTMISSVLGPVTLAVGMLAYSWLMELTI